jgi:hypothetical protein
MWGAEPGVIPELDNRVWVVAFHGEITIRTLIDVRATVRKIITECPATIVVDLHCCRVDPHLSLTFLPMLQRLARAADIRLLYTVGDDLADRLRRSWARDFIEAYPIPNAGTGAGGGVGTQQSAMVPPAVSGPPHGQRRGAATDRGRLRGVGPEPARGPCPDDRLGAGG